MINYDKTLSASYLYSLLNLYILFTMLCTPVHNVLEQLFHNSSKQMCNGHLKSKPLGKMFPEKNIVKVLVSTSFPDVTIII